MAWSERGWRIGAGEVNRRRDPLPDAEIEQIGDADPAYPLEPAGEPSRQAHQLRNSRFVPMGWHECKARVVGCPARTVSCSASGPIAPVGPPWPAPNIRPTPRVNGAYVAGGEYPMSLRLWSVGAATRHAASRTRVTWMPAPMSFICFAVTPCPPRTSQNHSDCYDISTTTGSALIALLFT